MLDTGIEVFVFFRNVCEEEHMEEHVQVEVGIMFKYRDMDHVDEDLVWNTDFIETSELENFIGQATEPAPWQAQGVWCP